MLNFIAEAMKELRLISKTQELIMVKKKKIFFVVYDCNLLAIKHGLPFKLHIL